MDFVCARFGVHEGANSLTHTHTDRHTQTHTQVYTWALCPNESSLTTHFSHWNCMGAGLNEKKKERKREKKGGGWVWWQ